MYMYIYTLMLIPSNNWIGFCGLHALVDPIARSNPFSVCGHKYGHKFGDKFGHKFGLNFGRNFEQTRKGKELLEPSN